MEKITSFNQLLSSLARKKELKRAAIVAPEDPHTLGAVKEGIDLGFVHPILIGDSSKFIPLLEAKEINPDDITILDIRDPREAAIKATALVKEGSADLLMKGLINTDVFLKPVLDKKNGLLPPGNVMTYTGALELPGYSKLLFFSDPAVIPNPSLTQKMAMINYAINMVSLFGITNPKVALISASEKVTDKMPFTRDYEQIVKLSQQGEFPNATIDGPLDLFLACDPGSVEIKGVPTPVHGEADILIFPNIESANAFYKGLMLFGRAQLGGLIQGTEKPVVLMSRSENQQAKLNCLALGCLLSQ